MAMVTWVEIKRVNKPPKEGEYRPLTWWWEGTTLLIVCGEGHLNQNTHKMADDGKMFPEARCGHKGCGYEANLILDRWDGDRRCWK